MKILQINAVYGMGSTGKIVRDISQTLIAQGHESYVMWATACRTDDSGVNLIRIGNTIDHKLHALLRRIHGSHGLHSKAATKKACKQILKIQPDVVHLHNLHSNYIHLPTLLDCLGKHNIPTLLTMHDCWFIGGYCMHYKNHNCQKWLCGCVGCPAVHPVLQKHVEKTFAQRKRLWANIRHLAVNGVSRWTTEAAMQSVLKTAEQAICIYNFVDTHVHKPYDCTAEVRQTYNIPAEQKLILGVSQAWTKEKGLDAFEMLSDNLKGAAQILLVGDGSGVTEKENLRCIGFTSSTEELVALYSAADVLVNASEAETFGLVTVEAMACGTPVVAYDNSGSSEIVDPQCGMLAADGDKEALLQAVKEVLEKGKASYTSACRKYVLENFEKESQLQKYLQFYEKIAASDPADTDKEK